MNTKPQSIRDILYEKPGAMICRLIRVGTVLSALLLVLLLSWVIYLFDKHGQLHPRYWSFFLQPVTWRFIGEGLSGTLQAALVAGAAAFLAGLAMMLLRLSSHKICQLCGRYRSVCSQYPAHLRCPMASGTHVSAKCPPRYGRRTKNLSGIYRANSLKNCPRTVRFIPNGSGALSVSARNYLLQSGSDINTGTSLLLKISKLSICLLASLHDLGVDLLETALAQLRLVAEI